jgi:hypothetical protein
MSRRKKEKKMTSLRGFAQKRRDKRVRHANWPVGELATVMQLFGIKLLMARKKQCPALICGGVFVQSFFVRRDACAVGAGFAAGFSASGRALAAALAALLGVVNGGEDVSAGEWTICQLPISKGTQRAAA